MPSKRLRLSVQKNIQLFEQLLLSIQKKFSAVKTVGISISEFKTIQPFEQQRFSVQQRESDQIQLFMTPDLANCHTLVTEHLSLLVYISKVLLYRCQDICCFFHFRCTENNKKRCQNKTFHSVVKLFPT